MDHLIVCNKKTKSNQKTTNEEFPQNIAKSCNLCFLLG